MTAKPAGDGALSGGPAARRSRGFRALADDVSRLTRPLFARRGLAEGAIVARWADVVGPALARLTLPERIIFGRNRRENGTLAVRVASGALALELQHLTPQLIERVNGFFGYRAVERIKLAQGPLPAPRTPAAGPGTTPSAEVTPALAARIEKVADDELRAALGALARTRGTARRSRQD